MQFDEALRYLLSLGAETVAIKLGLRNVELLLASLGNPQNSYPSVQIAGTNGKGSTAVVLDSICHAAGVKTGLYTSPHLISITERIKIGGVEISHREFAHHATAVRNTSEKLVNERQIEVVPTFFEQVTAIAFAAFRETNVALAILETGLGGRLDATSIAKAGLVAVMPIGLDHQEYLGESIEDIAAEKAAIIRPGSIAVIAPQVPQALGVILRQCVHSNVRPSVDECSVKVENVTNDGRVAATFKTLQDQYENVLPGLRGRHQITNVAVAIRLAESLRGTGFQISRSAIIEGIERASHPGRLELWEGRPSFLFDGAHNAAGIQALRDYLDEFVRVPITLVFGVMRDKNLEKMAASLFPVADRLILTQPDNPRAASLAVLEQVASRFVDAERISVKSSVRDAIRLARKVTPSRGLVCLSGSLYLIGEAKSVMKEMAAA